MAKGCEECRKDPKYIKSESNPTPPKVPNALYNIYSDDAKPIVCTKHKTEKMVDVLHKKAYPKTCRVGGCNTQPGFNKPGETSPIYCLACAKNVLGPEQGVHYIVCLNILCKMCNKRQRDRDYTCMVDGKSERVCATCYRASYRADKT